MLVFLCNFNTMLEFSAFKANLALVEKRITDACEACGRAVKSVSLLPVTKNHGVEAPTFASEAGLQAVGENRVQEAHAKRLATESLGLRWELIGHLQSNKAKEAVQVFDRIQSVDSLKLLKRLDRFAGEASKTLPILIQCNAGDDPNKYGFSVDAMEGAMEAVLDSKNLKVEGLMTIAPLDDTPEIARAAFDTLRLIRDQLEAKLDVSLPELSMGMTGDLEAAVQAGSTQIRVGTALYGQRDYT